MKFLPSFAVVAALWALASAGGAFAQDRASDVSAGADRSAYAQARPTSKRARTRIRVTPRCPYRSESVEYPPPAECDYPGPGYVRQCRSWLAREYRPSGTVVVPHMRCWWVRG